MNHYQIAAIFLLSLFYGAYLAKMYGQKKRGIITRQLGKGGTKGIKSQKTILVEKFLYTVHIIICAAIVISVILNWNIIQNNFLRTAGLILAALGCLFFILGMTAMKDNWRAGIPEEDETSLVIEGIYKISRNPAFAGFDMLYLGMALVFLNPLTIVLSVFAFISLHLQIIEEENFMEKRFGKKYLEYKSKTGRYFFFSK